MWFSLKRELQIPLEEENLDPKEEPHEVVEKPQIEEQRVERTTQVEPSREGKKRTRESGRLLQDVRENVGVPLNFPKQRRSPDRYTSYMALVIDLVDIEPSSFKETIEKPVWVDLMVEKYESIVNNSVWELVPRPTDKSVVGFRLIFQVKKEEHGSIEKKKGGEAKVYSQVEGINYDEKFSLVSRYSSIRLVLTFDAQTWWKIHQIDVKTMFLNGFIEEGCTSSNQKYLRILIGIIMCEKSSEH